ncbi:hypothetical protein PInf_004771 [Phytophthora infestans]|nr:hypothetical protein PInf_004771 [Phytophthora infestans]
MEVEADHRTDVTEVVADMVLSVETALPAQQSGITFASTDFSAEKRKRSKQVPTRERRRALLQEDSGGDDDTVTKTRVLTKQTLCTVYLRVSLTQTLALWTKELTNAPGSTPMRIQSFVTNLKDEGDADDDSWDSDWDIGELTDEDSDRDIEALPNTAWLRD